MNARVKRLPLMVGAILISLVMVWGGLLLSTIGATGHASAKPGPNAGARLADAELEALVAAVHVRNDEYLRRFVASGRDPRSLAVVEQHTWAGPTGGTPTLDAATAKAEIILHGRVREVTFTPSPTGGLPRSSATVDVKRTVKGQVASPLIVTQLGGPQPTESGGVLVRLDTTPLILGGDEVVLMLLRLANGSLVAVPGAGVYQIRNGHAEADHSSAFGSSLTGLTLDELLQRLAG